MWIYTDTRALQFDHIKGGIGRNRPTGWKRWKWLNESIERGDIQLLCANCNMIKKSQSEVETAPVRSGRRWLKVGIDSNDEANRLAVARRVAAPTSR